MPIKPRLYLLLLVLFLSVSGRLKATHIVGGELSYVYLGNDQYEVKLYLYVDCFKGDPNAINADVNSKIGVFNSAGILLQSLSLSRQGPQKIVGTNYSCVIPDPNACVDLYIYTSFATLPPINGGYTLVFQRCCRNGTIVNIVNPGSTGSTYSTYIPDRRIRGANNSAKFVGEPPNYLCKDEPLIYNHSAQDLDGDSLVYRLFQPLHGASQGAPQPMPENFTPITGVVWAASYSNTVQIISTPKMSIDSTGLFTVTPAQTGQFVVGIAVDEYRNGVLINTVFRDFQFNVVACNFDAKPIPNVQTGPCGNTVQFLNSSTGNISGYSWDFGDPTRTDDSSNAKSPSYTYPGPGKYTARLSVVTNAGCKAGKDILINILDTVDGLLPDTMNCYGTQVQLGNPGTEPGITWTWSPSGNLSNANIPNPIATITRNQTYIVYKRSPTCYITDSVRVFLDPIKADFIHEYLPPCDGLKVKYFARGNDYDDLIWDFGDPIDPNDQSTDTSTSWFYQDTGIMYVELKVSNRYCRDSITKPIRIIFPEIFTAVQTYAICLGDELTIGPLNDTSILSFVWSTDSFMSDGQALYPVVAPERSISYVLTKTYAHCWLKDSFSIQVNELPDLQVVKSDTNRICPGDTLMFIANGSYDFEWFPKNGIQSPFSGTTLVIPDSTRWYTLQARTGAGCTDTTNVFVEMYPLWELDLDPLYVVCKDAVFLPKVGIPDAVYTWKEDGSADYYVDSVRKEGYYILNVETQCQSLWDTFQLAYYTESYCTLNFPNAFTPNGDGINDTYPFDGHFHNIFGPECTFDSYYLIIFNRWGEIVFRTDNPSENWDGRYKENGGNQDVFGYYLTYREYDWCTGDYKIRVKRGNITVLH